MTLDQFELYNRTSVSGGIGSYVYFGDPLNTSQYFYRRGLIDKSAPPNTIEATINTVSGYDIGTMLQQVSASAYKDTSYMFQTCFTENEIFYDSVLPHPYEYAKVIAMSGSSGTLGPNGFSSLVAGNAVPIWDGLLLFEPTGSSASLAAGPSMRGIRLLTPATVKVPGAADQSVSLRAQKRIVLSPSIAGISYGNTQYPTSTPVGNRLWLHSYPFQGYYKNFQRLAAPTNRYQPSVFSTAIGLFRPLKFYWLAAGEIGYGQNATEGLYFVDLLTPYQVSLMYCLTSSLVFPTPQLSGTLVIYQQKSLDNEFFDLPDGPYLNRWFFGTGDGPGQMCLPRRTVKYLNTYTASINGVAIGGVYNSGTFYGIGIQQRGWKYGIHNGSPTSTQIVFRRSKYGQFRDMLEQRPYTKYFNGKSGLDAVIKINFVSGSRDFLTASSPNLNVRESGLYDFQAKSAMPFKD